MFDAAELLESGLDQLPEGALSQTDRGAVRTFIGDGMRIANWLHAYGHHEMDPQVGVIRSP
jgi:hypothetical protein